MQQETITTGGPAPETNSALPLLLVVARHLRILVTVPMAAGLLSIWYSLVVDPVYTATARILPPQYNENTVMGMQNQFGGESQLGNSALTLKNPTDLFVGILTSRTIVDAVIEANDLLEYYDEDEIGEVRRIVGAATEIRAAKDGIVSIAVEDTDRNMAATLANSYVDQFYAFSQALARQQARQRASFYENALNTAWQRLGAADVALAGTEKRTGFTRLDGQQAAIVQSVAELQAQIAAREIQLQTMASYATASNPDVRLIRRELRNLRAELARQQAGIDTDAVTAAPFITLDEVPDAMLQHAQGKRQVEYWENIVMLLGRFSELGKIDESRDMSLFQVLDRAIAPYDKSRPRTGINAILAAIGSGFGCLLWVLSHDYITQRRRLCPTFDRQWRELRSTLPPFARESKQ